MKEMQHADACYVATLRPLVVKSAENQLFDDVSEWSENHKVTTGQEKVELARKWWSKLNEVFFWGGKSRSKSSLKEQHVKLTSRTSYSVQQRKCRRRYLIGKNLLRIKTTSSSFNVRLLAEIFHSCAVNPRKWYAVNSQEIIK